MNGKTVLHWIALTVLLTVGCQPAQHTAETDSSATAENSKASSTANEPQRRALAARDALLKQLSARLIAAMSSGGPAAAIEVCSHEAPKLAASVGKDHKVAIGRTSLKLRNPKNAPPAWAEPLIAKKSEEPEFVELPGGETGALLPIRLNVQCLACHGPTDQIAENVKAKLAELYPEDRATGFQEGDLRGWFWVVVPAPAAEAARESLSSAERAFARFDEVYIPALALTQQQKAEPAKAALQRLSQRWKQLRPQLARAIAADSQWPQDLETIDDALVASADRARSGQFAEAHEALEGIRDLMMKARRRQQISYPLDSLSDFHTTMEEIVKPAMKFTPETVTDEDIDRLHAACSVADQKWKATEAAEFNLDSFGFDPSAAGRLRELIEAERQAIRNLQAALNGEDKQAIIEAARDLKPPFAKTYVFFGDFPQPDGNK